METRIAGRKSSSATPIPGGSAKLTTQLDANEANGR
jgi:hypothetical protein